MKCKQCSACCRYLLIWFGIKKPGSDYMRWINYHEGVKVVKRGDFYAIRIDSKCSKLKGNQCSIYKRRPKMCKEYNCWSGDYPKP